MHLHKTERARAALADHGGGLSVLERRILILSDGRRTADAVASMLGVDARAGVGRLVAAGYLSTTTRPPAGDDPHRDAPETVRRLFGVVPSLRRRAHVDASSPADPVPPPAILPAVVPASVPVAARATAPAPPAAPRRSLAACKMYVLDMLQLQRVAGARSHAIAIRDSGDPERLRAALLEALAFLQRATPPSYSRRVLDRVAEILPEDAVPALHAQREAIAAA